MPQQQQQQQQTLNEFEHIGLTTAISRTTTLPSLEEEKEER
jgi:hypothetical protein